MPLKSRVFLGFSEIIYVNFKSMFLNFVCENFSKFLWLQKGPLGVSGTCPFWHAKGPWVVKGLRVSLGIGPNEIRFF